MSLLMMWSLVAAVVAETMNVTLSEVHYSGADFLEISSGPLADIPTAKYKSCDILTI
jgi:hypothetical protein